MDRSKRFDCVEGLGLSESLSFVSIKMEGNLLEQQGPGEDMEDVMGDALGSKQKNTLPVYGNKETMNINPMILSNIQGSAYFKEELYKMKTFHEVIDEIFYKVSFFRYQI